MSSSSNTFHGTGFYLDDIPAGVTKTFPRKDNSSTDQSPAGLHLIAAVGYKGKTTFWFDGRQVGEVSYQPTGVTVAAVGTQLLFFFFF
jgi:hypothetical protein